MDGQLRSIVFNASAAWAAVPEDLRPLVIIAAVDVGAHMYVLANPLLVKIVKRVLGEDALLGDFLAHRLGYEIETYLFEGEENELASAIFRTKVADALTLGFDFKAAYYHKMSVENVLGMVDAVVTKYRPSQKADVVIEGLIELYGDTHIKYEIVEGTLGLEFDDVVDYLAEVAIAFVGHECFVTDIARIAKFGIGGELRDVYLHAEQLITDALINGKAILDHIVRHDVIDSVFTELGRLYEGVIIGRVLEGTLAINVNDLLNSTANVVVTALPSLNECLVRDIVRLTNSLITGPLNGITLNGDSKVSDIIIDVWNTLDHVVEHRIIDVVFAELINLYQDISFRNIKAGTLGLDVDRVITAVHSITDEIVAHSMIDFVYSLLHAGLSGTLGSIKFNAADVWAAIPEDYRPFAIAAGVGVGAVLYFAANDLLVSLVNKVVADATVGDVLADNLGYTVNDGIYSRDGIVNSLINEVFNERAIDLVATGYDLGNKIFTHVTLGNLLTVTSDIQAKAEGILPGEAPLTKKSYEEWTMVNSIVSVMDIILNVSLKDILDNKDDLKGYALSLVEQLRVGDIVFADMLGRLQSGVHPLADQLGVNITSTKLENGKWDFEGSFEKLLEVTLNYTVGDVKAAIDGGLGGIKLLVIDAISHLTMGDIVGEALIALNNRAEKAGQVATYNAIYDEATGKWLSTEAYAKLIATVCNISAYDFIINTKAQGKEYLLTAVLGDMRVGELIDGYNVYDEVNKVWTNKGEKIEFGYGIKDHVKQVVYEMKIANIINKNIDYDALMDGFYMGELLGYTCEGNLVDGHVHDASCVWFSKQDVYVEGVGVINAYTQIDALTQRISSLDAHELIEGTLDIISVVEEITLGELMHLARVSYSGSEDVYYNFKTKDGLNEVILDENGYAFLIVDLAKPADKLTNALAGILVKDITHGDGIGTIMGKVEALKIGDIFRYTEGADGWYNGTTLVTGLLGKLCDYTLSEVKNDFGGIIDEFTLGDVIEVTDGSLLSLLADKKISELESEIQKLYVGQIMGYTYDEVNDAWFVDEAMVTPVDKLSAAIAGVKVSELTGGNGVTVIMDNIEALKLGDILRYTEGVDGWYNGTAPVTGLIGKLCDYTLTEIKEDFGGIVNDFTVGDVIEVTDGSLLELLEDKKIGQLSSAIDELYIGEVMGYKKDQLTDTWYTDTDADGLYDAGEEVTDDIVKILVDYKIKDLDTSFSSNLLAKIKTDVKLSTFIGYNDCDVFKVFTEAEYNALTLTSLSTEFEKKLSKDASLDVLVQIGIVKETDLTDARKAKITELYNFGKADSEKKTWEQITMADFFDIVFGLIDSAPVLP